LLSLVVFAIVAVPLFGVFLLLGSGEKTKEKAAPKKGDEEPEEITVTEAADEHNEILVSEAAQDEHPQGVRTARRSDLTPEVPVRSEHPETPVSDEERKMAMFAYLSSLIPFIGFLGPLVIYFMKKDSPFVVFHCKQWLNAAITLFCFGLGYWIVTLVATFGATFVGYAVLGASGVFLGLAVWALALLVGLGVVVTFVVFLILTAIKAKDGQWARVPYVWQLFR
jgi:uncharacterized Tic20 family protein